MQFSNNELHVDRGVFSKPVMLHNIFWFDISGTRKYYIQPVYNGIKSFATGMTMHKSKASNLFSSDSSSLIIRNQPYSSVIEPMPPFSMLNLPVKYHSQHLIHQHHQTLLSGHNVGIFYCDCHPRLHQSWWACLHYCALFADCVDTGYLCYTLLADTISLMDAKCLSMINHKIVHYCQA